MRLLTAEDRQHESAQENAIWRNPYRLMMREALNAIAVVG
jgi:hypothetical protein